MFEFAFALLGALLGAAIDDEEGAVVGAFFGALLGFLVNTRLQLGRQRVELEALRSRVDTLAAQMEPVELELDLSHVEPQASSDASQAQPGFVGTTSTTQERPSAEAISAPASAAIEGIAGRVIGAVVGFIRGGNPMVRIGVIVLFFGIAFLAKLAVDANLIPIELRMAGIAGVGLVLVVLGFRFRHTRPTFALPLQGGGIGVMFLTVFAAYRLYDLMPAVLTFGLLVTLVALSVVLAVVQNSLVLAAFGVASGFLAPIFASSGSGDHVALFSFYLLLNVGIGGIAWFKTWRVLNWLGFVFTFVIGAAWGADAYQPELFASTEPFLLAHFVLYVMLSVLFARRQPPKLRGLVDSTLVFGTPLVVFALQSQVVKDIDMGLAWSAVAGAAFYIFLAFGLARQRDMRLLSEAFIATGVVLATIAVPLALDARWTSVTWALEGAGALWIGVRQNRLLPRLAGVGLQLLAGVSLVIYLEDTWWSGDFLLNSSYLGAALVAVAGLFCGAYLARARASIHAFEYVFSILLGVWGMTWWYGAGIVELLFHGDYPHHWGAFLVLTSITASVALLLRRRDGWGAWQFPIFSHLWWSLALLLIMGIDASHAFVGWAAFGWPLALAMQFFVLRQLEDWRHVYRDLLHGASVWLVLALLGWTALEGLQAWLDRRDLWELVPAGFVTALIVIRVSGATTVGRWPFATHARAYLMFGTAPLLVLLGLWVWSINLTPPGREWPIAYAPIVNPIDLTIGFALLAAARWWRTCDRVLETWALAGQAKIAVGVLAATLFLWANAILCRSIHFWAGVRYDFDALWGADVTQTSLAIFWSAIGVAGMVFGARAERRVVWLVAASLMGVVVLKLFFVDLANTDTLERVISFVSVGALMVLVGYFAPVPPRRVRVSEPASPSGAEASNEVNQ